VGPRALLLGLIALALLTALMLAFRVHLDKAHIALLLLLVPLGGSAAGGRAVGLSLAAASFLVFNWFFLPPYHTFTIADPLDWLVLLTFLVTSVVAAQLLYAAQEEARSARERAAEVDRLRVVGAEALNAGRAEDALATVASVIREVAQVDHCAILTSNTGHPLTIAASATVYPEYTSQHDDQLAEWVAESNHAAVERVTGSVRLRTARPDATDQLSLATGEVRALLLPLSVRDRGVGVLRLEAARGIRLDGERWRFVDALSYYAALGVERVRLVAAEEHAEALREADRLKDALLASVSHDLRTPLTTIKARAHEMRVHGDERAEVIEQEADRLNRLVADLLDLSRLNAGVLPVTLELNAVDELIELVVQRVEGALAERPLEVRLSRDGELLFGRFDLAHSVRILVNLVENAHKYSPPDAPIELSARRDGGQLVIEVLDRGCGLDPEELERVFEPFHRSASAATGAGGTGLGLSIARRLAEAQGGSLGYSHRGGGGSAFFLVLPAVGESGRLMAL
jgi:two-component system sensor histidine kinase KdpD